MPWEAAFRSIGPTHDRRLQSTTASRRGAAMGGMTGTPAVRRIPEAADVVEVYGSKFLLEWLDRDVLASAAALHLAGQFPIEPGKRAA
jgi:hypothetical protein